VVPWKYGFKHQEHRADQPGRRTAVLTTWSGNCAAEYGFYANVNPEVDHPRWSQASERRIGEVCSRRRRTLMFNGYAEQVAGLYAGMDLDLQMRWSEIGADLVKRPHIIAGMLGFVALVPLALTSNDRALRRLGAAAWQRLHLLTYVAVLLGAVHYLMLVKTWTAEPVLYALAAAGLVALRLLWRRGRVARATA
jgi:hypothetical protein